MSVTPELVDSIDQRIARKLAAVYTCLVCRVETYDETLQTCSVQPLIKGAYEDESGARVTENLPVITDVPVLCLGSAIFAVTFPLKAGDQVMVIFSQQALGKWLTVGANKPIDPNDDRSFSITDAIAIPGVRNNANKLAESSAADFVLGKNNTAAVIKFKADTTIEAGGANLLALKTDVDNIKTFLGNQFDTAAGHRHVSGGPPVSGGAGSGTGYALPTITGTAVLKGA